MSETPPKKKTSIVIPIIWWLHLHFFHIDVYFKTLLHYCWTLWNFFPEYATQTLLWLNSEVKSVLWFSTFFNCSFLIKGLLPLARKWSPTESCDPPVQPGKMSLLGSNEGNKNSFLWLLTHLQQRWNKRRIQLVPKEVCKEQAWDRWLTSLSVATSHA